MKTQIKTTFLLTFWFLISAFSVAGQEKSKTFHQGTEHFRNKEYDEALKCFEKEYKTNPVIEVKFWIAHTYAEMKQISKAKPLFIEIINSDTNAHEIGMSLINLGNCYRKTGPTDSAHFYYDRAINEFPNMDGGYFNKAQLLYAESKFEEAKSLFNKAIDINPNDWFYYQKRLEVCFATQDYEGALRDLLKVRELMPDIKIEWNLAFCYSMLERYQEADSVFQLIYNENDAFLMNNYGMNKHKMGKTEEGKKLIMKSLSISPGNSYIYRNLAIIAIDEKNNSKACEYLNKAKSLGFEKQYGTEVNELILNHCE